MLVGQEKWRGLEWGGRALHERPGTGAEFVSTGCPVFTLLGSSWDLPLSLSEQSLSVSPVARGLHASLFWLAFSQDLAPCQHVFHWLPAGVVWSISVHPHLTYFLFYLHKWQPTFQCLLILASTPSPGEWWGCEGGHSYPHLYLDGVNRAKWNSPVQVVIKKLT